MNFAFSRHFAAAFTVCMALISSPVVAQELGAVGAVGTYAADRVGELAGTADRSATLGKATATKGETGAAEGKRDRAERRTEETTEKRPGLPALLPNEFQKYIDLSTGSYLPIFGHDYFGSASEFNPAETTPVAPDHRIGPGDELKIRLWGSVEGDITAVVDRDGQVSIPKVGTLSVAGVRANDIENLVRSALSKTYKGFNLSVVLGRIRGITVFLVGQARLPGTYTLPSQSTVVTALLKSGGPNATGSLRHVLVKREGRQIAELDLYALFGNGDKASDLRLVDGDVIVIPPATGYVALVGAIETPRIYELKSESDTLNDILKLAGGLPLITNPSRALLEQLDANRAKPRSVQEISLEGQAKERRLKSGDVVRFLPIRTEFDNVVFLRGAIDAPVRVPFKAGMKITDLIPNREFLIARSVVNKQNDQILVNSTGRPTNLLTGKSEEFARKTEEFGRKDDAPTTPVPGFIGDIGNKFEIINWDYAVVERVNAAKQSVTLLPFNLGRALEAPQSIDNLALAPGDTVNILTIKDVQLPVEKQPVYVRIEGEVGRPGVYQVGPGESLSTLVEKAGGLTADAYLFGAEFTRESVRRAQQESLDRYIKRLEHQAFSDHSRVLQNSTAQDAAGATLAQSRVATQEETIRRFITQLKQARSTGRIAMTISPTSPSIAQLPNVRMENGDRLRVPARPDFVQVLGAVNTEAAMLWRANKTISDVIDDSGVTQDGDVSSTFVIRANGVIVSNSGRWLSSVTGTPSMPGDVIVVPEKADKENTWNFVVRNAKDVSQILANFGLAAAAIQTLRK